MTIRPAKIEDAARLCPLNRDDLGYDLPLEEVTAKLALLLELSYHRILVAEMAGDIIGYVHAEEYDTLYAPKLVNILGIAVCEKARGMGAGKALLGEIERWAEEIGAVGIRLTSGAGREGAHKFYEHLGYKSGGAKMSFYKYF